MERLAPSLPVAHMRPLPVANMHVQTAPAGGSQRLPFGTGQLEVLRIQRIHKDKGSATGHPAQNATLLLDGIPASSHSSSRQALFVFMPEGVDPPLARMDHEHELLTVHYRISDFERINQLLRTGSRRVCYCWLSADSTRSVVMLMAMG